MKRITAREVRRQLEHQLEDDRRDAEETLHLMAIPEMAESIREGMRTPIADCVEELDW